MRILQIIWTFIKKYWELFLLLAGAFVAIVLFRQQRSTFVEDVKKLQDAHDEEIKKINAARDEERRIAVENQKKLTKALELVQAQYDDAKKELDEKKKKEIEQLVKEYGNKPDELAKRLSEATGFVIVMPQD
jgi:seryl-tRNA synthetase